MPNCVRWFVKDSTVSGSHNMKPLFCNDYIEALECELAAVKAQLSIAQSRTNGADSLASASLEDLLGEKAGIKNA